MPDDMIGALAGALAKAQAAFPAITRDKSVTVTSKRTGSTYTFKYAPLDKIIEKTRGPLGDNGLAVAQLLDSDADGAPALVTMLLHEGGGTLTGRTPIPHSDNDTAQEFGSAVTYLRRYAYTAILGIATEDDDDGNRAAGNAVKFTDKGKPDEPYTETEDLTGRIRRKGTVRKGTADGYKLDARLGPEGHVIGFRLEVGTDKSIPQCVVAGPLGEALYLALAEHPETLAGKVVTVAGILYHVKTPKGTWYRLHVDSIETPDFTLPAEEAAEPTTDNADAARVGSSKAPTAQPSGPICGAKGPASIPGGAVCNQEPHGPEAKHRELASDGRVLASW